MDDPSSIFTWLLTMAAIPLVVRPTHFMSDSQKQTKNSIPRRRRSRTTVDPIVAFLDINWEGNQPVKLKLMNQKQQFFARAYTVELQTSKSLREWESMI